MTNIQGKTNTTPPKFQGTGKCLLPGEPGYDEALKRVLAAKKAREEQEKKNK